MQLADLNALDEPSAVSALLRCCGSTAWAARMTAARPFATLDVLMHTADRVWGELAPADWLEAFAAHPKIGGRAGPDTARDAGPESWSAHEQAGVRDVAPELAERLARGNREYEARFGYIFIVCATGRSAAEMLAALDQRLANTRDRELTIAAEEQRRITRLRLAKLLDRTENRHS